MIQGGNSQALRLAKEFQLRGKQVYIKRMGNCIVVIPEDNPWKNAEESAARFTDHVFEEGRWQVAAAGAGARR
ncbi:MAG: AbrB/MazE/SpoVT family DNA-binding domain-containing protein [Deltaproteobacteria bacterium]|nr:AbrB/MazE/SpoVT family DNA-binding domain-containing protein [Deltaproteobacteria bacterium]